MAGLLSTFGPNPLNTPVGQKIEQATDASLPAENWALNMEICDMINTSEDACKDAVKAIRKRLQQNMGKNYTVVLYTLTVLETCVKNCGRRFHLLITQKDFIMDLVKLIGPKNDPPLAIQDRILGLIQSWADAFQSVPDMQGVVQAYQDLKQKGIEFPMTDLDSMAPILTPQKSVVTSSPTVPKGPNNPPQPSEVSKQPSSASATVESATSKSSSTGLSQEQLVKIRSELDIVQCNMKVFGEMLTELTPGHEHSEDLQLLQDLHKTLVAMQNRIVELIDRVGVEEVTGELLHINDELNNLFLRYERYEKKQKAVQGSAEGLLLASKDVPKEAVDEPKVSSVVDQTPPSSQASADAPLIDFGDFTDVAAEGTVTGIQKLSVADGDTKKKPSGENEAAAAAAATSIVDEFDMFAQSRNVSYEAAKTRGSSYADNTNLEHLDEGLAFYAQRKGQSALRDDDVQNISRWLDDKPSANSNDEDFVPNPEFDKFLAERAAAAERLPDVTPKTTESSGVSLAPPPPSTGRRQADKSSAESSLFNL